MHLMSVATAVASAISSVERKFLCSDGITLAATCYRPDSAQQSITSRKILCLHGWLDNAASFHLMAPELARRGLASEIVALDLPGHGMSSHKSPDCPQLLSEYLFHVVDVAAQLEWNKFTLVGHSMGADISTIFASCFPEKVESLVLLDSFAPVEKDARDFSKHLRESFEKRLKSNKLLYNPLKIVGDMSLKGNKIYTSIEKAVEARIKTASFSPGSQYISREAARALVERAIVTVNSDKEQVQFRHDPRLVWPSIQYLTREQVESILLNIKCPVCILMAEDGWPVEPELHQKYINVILKPEMYCKLAGSHHFHADPDSAIAVVDKVDLFLRPR